MSKDIGVKIRQLRELKGFSQEFMAQSLSISQRSYSKLERNEVKLDWEKIREISSVLEIEPMDLINFDENLIFNNCTQSGKFSAETNNITNVSEKLIEQYEKRIKQLEEEVQFLRGKI